MSDTGLTELFASFVPKMIQRRVIEDPKPIDSPVAQNFPAVVLFADISGFTTLTERLAEKGPLGVETLARILNEYFGQLIDTVYEYGGDVVKFAGDALIAVWPIPSEVGVADPVSMESLRQWTLRATECALDIREQLLDYRTEGSRLYLKLALATGRVWQSHIGGVFNRWEFVLVGEPLIEVGVANDHARAGDIILTQSSWALIKDDCNAVRFEFTLKGARQTAARLKSLRTASRVPAGREPLQLPHEAQVALRPYIPGAIIHRISAGQSDWLAELRKVTIMFINLPELGQKTELQFAQDIMRSIQRMVYRFEGSVNKISQDDKGVMVDVAFGLPPLTHTDDPTRGLQAAMALRTELQSLGLRGSVGVTTGRVFCGLVGTNERRVYTLIGHSVNMTARLMSLASQRRAVIERDGIAILCDRATYEAAKDQIEFENLTPQKIKGRSELVDAFNPLREKTGVVQAKTELIGRGEEKTLLVNGIQELQKGTPFQAIILHGEAGIGKSRLMEELVRQAQASQVKTFIGEGDSIEKNSPYFAWRAIFNRVLGIEELANKPQLSAEDRTAVQKAVLAKLREIDPEFMRYAPLLSVILPISIPDNEFTSAMSGEVRGGNIRDLLVMLLQHETNQSPILVAIEDLHWFDSASWTLLGDVYQKVRPLLLVVNTRPLWRPVPVQFQELAYRPETTFVRLDMMSLDNVEALVCQRLGVKSVPPQVGKMIRDKSEGHPFFAEELAYALRDTGVLVIEGQDCHLAPGFDHLEAVTLPDNLQAAITSRIDGLNPSQQLTLKVASVIGRIFAYRILEAIHPIEQDRPALPDYLQALTHLRLTQIESETPDLAYIFKHAITQEVAYNLMLFSQRRQLHQSVAEWIEQSYEQDLESFYPLLAYHWKQAANTPDVSTQNTVVTKAIDYLEKAGDQSLKNFANAEAIQFFSEVLALADTNKIDQLRLGQWYRKIGDAYLGSGRIVEAKEYIVRAMKIFGLPLPASDVGLLGGVLKQAARQAGHRLWPSRYRGKELDPREKMIRMELIILAEKLAVVQYLSGDPNPLPMLYGVMAGLNIGETLDDTPALWTMYATMSAVMGFIPLHSQAQYYKDRWFALGQKINDPDAYVDGAISLCAVASGNGAWREVSDLIEKAAEICEEIGDHRRGAESVTYLAINKLIEAGPGMAEPYIRREWEIAMRRENPIHIGFSYQNDCTAMVWRGEYDECIANARKCLALSEKSWVGDIPENIVRSAMWLAMWLKGEREGVWEGVKAALDKFAKASIVDYSAYLIYSHLAEIAFLALEEGKKNDLSNAQRNEVEKYAKIAMKNMKKYLGVFAIGGPALDRYRGQFEWYSDKHDTAYELWQAAVEKAHSFPIAYEAGRAELMLGQHLPADDPERTAHLQRAREIFTAAGCENWAALAGDLLNRKAFPAQD
ncbi:MAG TPA: adenylate/guanylate cyclase domain-containing protein [Anaerolineales bacterium]|nr:adenylate/guanylate cyclase domain-containing protein [Anaerolineales bacterium]